MTEKRPTYGYNAAGEAKIFDLEKGDKLPAGWHSKPVKPEQHPNHPDYNRSARTGDTVTISGVEAHLGGVDEPKPATHAPHVDMHEAKPAAKPVRGKK